MAVGNELLIVIKAVDDASLTISKVSKSLSDAKVQIMGFNSEVASLTRAVGVVTTGIAVGAAKAASDIVGSYEDMETAMAALRMAMRDATEEELADLESMLIRISKELPDSVTGLIDYATEVAKIGISGTENIERMILAAIKLREASGDMIDADTAVASLGKILTAFDLAWDEAERVGSVISELALATPAEFNEMLEETMKLAAMGEVFGLTMPETSAMIAQIISYGHIAGRTGLRLSRGIQLLIQNNELLAESALKTAEAYGLMDQELIRTIQSGGVKELMKEDPMEFLYQYFAFLEAIPGNIATIEELQEVLGWMSAYWLPAVQGMEEDVEGMRSLTETMALANDAWARGTGLQELYEKRLETVATQTEITTGNVETAKALLGGGFGPALMELMENVLKPFSARLVDIAAAFREMRKEGAKTAEESRSWTFDVLETRLEGISNAIEKALLEGDYKPALAELSIAVGAAVLIVESWKLAAEAIVALKAYLTTELGGMTWNIGKMILIGNLVFQFLPEETLNALDEATDRAADAVEGAELPEGIKSAIQTYLDKLGEEQWTTTITIGITWALAAGAWKALMAALWGFFKTGGFDVGSEALWGLEGVFTAGIVLALAVSVAMEVGEILKGDQWAEDLALKLSAASIAGWLAFTVTKDMLSAVVIASLVFNITPTVGEVGELIGEGELSSMISVALGAIAGAIGAKLLLPGTVAAPLIGAAAGGMLGWALEMSVAAIIKLIPSIGEASGSDLDTSSIIKMVGSVLGAIAGAIGGSVIMPGTAGMLAGAAAGAAAGYGISIAVETVVKLLFKPDEAGSEVSSDTKRQFVAMCVSSIGTIAGAIGGALIGAPIGGLPGGAIGAAVGAAAGYVLSIQATALLGLSFKPGTTDTKAAAGAAKEAVDAAAQVATETYEDVIDEASDAVREFYGHSAAIVQEVSLEIARGAIDVPKSDLDLLNAVLDETIAGLERLSEEGAPSEDIAEHWNDMILRLSEMIPQIQSILEKFKIAFSDAGHDAAQAFVDAFDAGLGSVAVASQVTTDVTVTKQAGGPVYGVGSGDIVPAMLEPGEFVIPKWMMKIPWLSSLIAGIWSGARGYQGGGPVAASGIIETVVSIIAGQASRLPQLVSIGSSLAAREYKEAGLDVIRLLADVVNDMAQETERAVDRVSSAMHDLFSRAQNLAQSFLDLIIRSQQLADVQGALKQVQSLLIDALLGFLAPIRWVIEFIVGSFEVEAEAVEEAAQATRKSTASLNIPTGYKLERAAWGVAAPGQPWGEEEEGWSETGRNLKDVFDNVPAWLKEIIEGFRSALEEASKGIKEFVERMQEIWQELAPVIIEALLPVLRYFGDALGWVADKVYSILLPVLTGHLPKILWDLGRAFSDLMASGLVVLAGFIADVVIPVVGTFAEALAEVASWIRTVLVPDLLNMFAAIGDWWRSDVEPFLNENVFPQLQEWFMAIYTWISTEFMPFLANEVWPFISGPVWGAIVEGLTMLGDVFMDIWNIVKDKWPEIKDWIVRKIGDFFGGVTSDMQIGFAQFLLDVDGLGASLEYIWTNNSLDLWTKVKLTFAFGLQTFQGQMALLGFTLMGIGALFSSPVALIIGGIMAVVGVLPLLAGAIGNAIQGIWNTLLTAAQGIGNLLLMAADIILFPVKLAMNTLIWIVNAVIWLINLLPGVNIPSLPYIPLEEGGHVLEEGLAYLHRGETVVPARAAPYGGQSINIQQMTVVANDPEEFMEKMEAAIRRKNLRGTGQRYGSYATAGA